MREKLPPRRQGVTVPMAYTLASGYQIDFVVTYNFNAEHKVKECFCLPFKTGTDLQNLLHHACIVTSMVLQHGSTMSSLARTMGEDEPARSPQSILGLIVRAGVELDREASPPVEKAQVSG